MKKYVKPEMEIRYLAEEDVVRTSETPLEGFIPTTEDPFNYWN